MWKSAARILFSKEKLHKGRKYSYHIDFLFKPTWFYHRDPSPTGISSSTPTIAAFTQQLKACLHFLQLPFQTAAGLLKYSFVHIIPFAQKRTLKL